MGALSLVCILVFVEELGIPLYAFDGHFRGNNIRLSYNGDSYLIHHFLGNYKLTVEGQALLHTF